VVARPPSPPRRPDGPSARAGCARRSRRRSPSGDPGRWGESAARPPSGVRSFPPAPARPPPARTGSARGRRGAVGDPPQAGSIATAARGRGGAGRVPRPGWCRTGAVGWRLLLDRHLAWLRERACSGETRSRAGGPSWPRPTPPASPPPGRAPSRSPPPGRPAPRGPEPGPGSGPAALRSRWSSRRRPGRGGRSRSGGARGR